MTKGKHRTMPNFLFIMVDEERFPMVYENEELRKWRRTHLKTHRLLEAFLSPKTYK